MDELLHDIRSVEEVEWEFTVVLEQEVCASAERELNAVVEFTNRGDGGSRVAVEAPEDTDQVLVSNERHGVLVD